MDRVKRLNTVKHVVTVCLPHTPVPAIPGFFSVRFLPTARSSQEFGLAEQATDGIILEAAIWKRNGTIERVGYVEAKSPGCQRKHCPSFNSQGPRYRDDELLFASDQGEPDGQ